MKHKAFKEENYSSDYFKVSLRVACNNVKRGDKLAVICKSRESAIAVMALLCRIPFKLAKISTKTVRDYGYRRYIVTVSY